MAFLRRPRSTLLSQAHYEHLATFTRPMVLSLARGLGMSDPLTVGGGPRLEQQVADLLAVLDAANSKRASLYASGDGTLVALPCSWPCTQLGFVDSSSTVATRALCAHQIIRLDLTCGDFDHPGLSAHERWGDRRRPRASSSSRQPVADPRFREVLARVQQVSASRAAAAAAMSTTEHDVRELYLLCRRQRWCCAERTVLPTRPSVVPGSWSITCRWRGSARTPALTPTSELRHRKSAPRSKSSSPASVHRP